MEHVLRFDNVTVLRDGRPIVQDLTWSVAAHERWVVLGPNGAGKTTLLSMAAARMFPSSGTVTLLGEEVGAVDLFELRPRIGLASPALSERIPDQEIVRDVVVTASYAVLGRGHEEYAYQDTVRATRLMQTMGVAHLADRVYHTLSDGERKRVHLARALMTDPEVMLLDEPAAGLDLAGREDFLQRLTALARDQRAPAQVLVTHHVEEIPIGFTHVLMIRDGRKVAAGPLHDVMNAQNLANTFGTPLWLSNHEGRWMAYAVRANA